MKKNKVLLILFFIISTLPFQVSAFDKGINFGIGYERLFENASKNYILPFQVGYMQAFGHRICLGVSYHYGLGLSETTPYNSDQKANLEPFVVAHYSMFPTSYWGISYDSKF